MEYGIKKSIIEFKKNSYAKEIKVAENHAPEIDCSAGINPFGFSEKVKRALTEMSLELINNYPESNSDLKDAIADYWSDVVSLKNNNILLGDGSIDIIYKINKLFLDHESKVLGYSPQFSDYIDDVQSYGGIYDYYLMTIENNYKFMAELFSQKITKEHNLIYLDNPNNPTGQVIPISSIKEIVKKAKKLGICVIVDEAYGDFMDKRNSAVSLLNRYDNLFVLRTFSKGLGLAGIRGGYLITSELLSDYYLKTTNPYSMNAIGRYLTIAALKDTSFIDGCTRKIRQSKGELMNTLKKLIVVETDLNVPIMTIKHPNSQIDLEEELKKFNILSISGKKFIGLDKNYVRLRIPEDINPLINAFRKMEQSI